MLYEPDNKLLIKDCSVFELSSDLGRLKFLKFFYLNMSALYSSGFKELKAKNVYSFKKRNSVKKIIKII